MTVIVGDDDCTDRADTCISLITLLSKQGLQLPFYAWFCLSNQQRQQQMRKDSQSQGKHRASWGIFLFEELEGQLAHRLHCYVNEKQ